MATRDEWYSHEARLEREEEGDVERCIECNGYFAIEEMLLEANASYSGFTSICQWCYWLRPNNPAAGPDGKPLKLLSHDGGRNKLGG